LPSRKERSQVITVVDALTLGPDKFRTEAGIYLGLRSIFWSLVRAKSDDDLREVAAAPRSSALRSASCAARKAACASEMMTRSEPMRTEVGPPLILWTRE
jgi:hypothetical protein